MKRSPLLTALFVAVLIAAIGCIGFGGYKVWESFKGFEESILREKDSQFYSLISSDDINIENTIDSFIREADTFFARDRLRQRVTDWHRSGRKEALETYLLENPVRSNPIYADLLVLSNDVIQITADGGGSYTFLTGKDNNGLRICMDDAGKYYLAYEFDYDQNTSFDALIDLTVMYDRALGDGGNRGLMLMDSASTVLIRRSGGETLITPVSEDADDNTVQCRDYMVQCQQEGTSNGASLVLKDANGNDYTARIVAMPSSMTVNGEFALGISANYEETLRPSRDAARLILIYGGMVVAAIIVLITMTLLLGRANLAGRVELADLKKRNKTMEEINQKMQLLAHHQRLEAIGTMTASIAHDFNNLLTPIMGYSIMAMEQLPEYETEIQEYLMEVYNASVKAKDMVTRLAEISKKGKEENFSILNVDEVIRNALKVTFPAKPKTVEVKGSFSSGQARIKGDRTQISQLVINIVLNAYDVMRETGGLLLVSTRRKGSDIVIVFKDNGSGMDAETVTRIFDPFYTTKESGKGTGLGLAIVAQIVETHGGRIYVDSQPGEGTEFRIELPQVRADGTPVPRPEPRDRSKKD